jgi:hypothetical protein
MTRLTERSHLVSVLCTIGKVGWPLVAAAKRPWALCDRIVDVCVIVAVAMLLCPLAVNGFWATWDIIAVAMGMLLKDAFNCYMLLCGDDAQKQKAVHSSMAWYVHVLVYNAAKQMFAS